MPPPGPSLPIRRRLGLVGWGVLALGPALLLAIMIWQRRWTSDDGFINFRVVSNLLAGHGPVFNVGERVEAFTSPLWIALLTALGALGLGLERSAVAAGQLFAVLGVLFAQLAAATALIGETGRWTSLRRRWLVPLGMVCFVVVPPAWDFGSAGLETGLCLAWLGLSYWLVSACVVVGKAGTTEGARALTGRLGYGTAAALGLGPLVRPELALFSIALAVPLAMVVRRQVGRGWQTWLGMAAAMAALPLTYQLFRMGYYAALVPNTALAKEAFSSRWDQGWRYAQNFFGVYLLPLPLILAAVSWDGLCRRAARRRDAPLLALLCAPPVAALLSILYVVRLGGGFMHGRLFLPALFGYLLPAAMVPLRVPSPAARWRWLRWLAAGIILGWALHCGLRTRVGPENIDQIGDERGWYSRKAGVRNPVTLEDYRGFGFHRVARELKARGGAGCPDEVLPTEARLDHGCRPFVIIDDTRTFGLLHPEMESSPVAQGTVHPAVAMVVAPGALGIVGQVLGPAAHLEDRYGLSNPVGARLQLGRRNRPGHEKKLMNVWLAARFAEPQPGEDPRVSAARRALGCGDLAALRSAVSDELTAPRFFANLGAAFTLHGLRIPLEPWRAEERYCAVRPFRVTIRGGPGGGPRQFHCPRGQVVTMMGGSLSTRQAALASIAPRCQRLEDGDGGLVPVGRPISGPRMGRQANQLLRLGCPDDQLLVGIHGGASKLVQRIGPVCRPLSQLTAGAARSESIRQPAHGSGGEDFDQTCPAGEVMVGVVARSGRLVDALGIVCADLGSWR